ncbi:fumarylacetoacetate hydrolase family protein [Novosphingobium sp. SL115]|uniref:fumarylacetoacetate hydrolase family protein n=1 Tax=Novosphingobium sp. SL115 TaxID=2995150 RepID=UPI002DD43946|nr:fumarylacetoacetate hydrolase family protein [Novosphingobium sp. SL115]
MARWSRSCNLRVERNGKQFGLVDGSQMAFSFPELIAYAARTRDLVPGTIIGSGTVSNREYAERGSACISERRAIEMIAVGAPQTEFLRYGENVRMTGITLSGHRPFGDILQQIVQA